ncbi:hypothetical protein VTL71DRAFT_15676 [Oculimacula yallundae]|uniref:Peptidase A1 domain-containing protein n=1 Tax=Oculimacula yallundae TaxID=86028 RepID=A0ABR4CJE9_9HELO
MSLPNFLVASAIFVLGIRARAVEKDGLTTPSAPASLEAPADIPIADYTLTLSKIPLTESLTNFHRSLSADSLRTRGLQPAYAPGQTVHLYRVSQGSQYAADVTWGNQTVGMLIDSGSADAWVAEAGFVCHDFNSKQLAPQANCTFGALYNRTDSLRLIPDSKFNKQYGIDLRGEHLQGVMAYETMTMGGLTVQNQEFGLVNNASWVSGDYKSTGLLGMAYPSRSNALRKNATGQYVRETYDTFFSNLWKQAKIKSNLFSMILNRNINGTAAPIPGYLSFGGVPDVPFTQNFTSTPIQLNKFFDNTTLTYYMIFLNSLNINGKKIAGSGGKDVSYMVDSGTSTNNVPTVVLDQIAAAFSPPGKFVLYNAQNPSGGGQYQFLCNATAPLVEFDIEGTLFPINKEDLWREDGGICYLNFADGGDASKTFMMLGTPFLYNVVSVYDVGASMMRFAQRAYY